MKGLFLYVRDGLPSYIVWLLLELQVKPPAGDNHADLHDYGLDAGPNCAGLHLRLRSDYIVKRFSSASSMWSYRKRGDVPVELNMNLTHLFGSFCELH